MRPQRPGERLVPALTRDAGWPVHLARPGGRTALCGVPVAYAGGELWNPSWGSLIGSCCRTVQAVTDRSHSSRAPRTP